MIKLILEVRQWTNIEKKSIFNFDNIQIYKCVYPNGSWFSANRDPFKGHQRSFLAIKIQWN